MNADKNGSDKTTNEMVRERGHPFLTMRLSELVFHRLTLRFSEFDFHSASIFSNAFADPFLFALICG
jgi:hypothetical protein